MFVKITRKNSYGEELQAVVNTDEIVAIKENHQKDLFLYDGDGNQVPQGKEDKSFTLLLTRGDTYKLTENAYNDLVKELIK